MFLRKYIHRLSKVFLISLASSCASYGVTYAASGQAIPGYSGVAAAFVGRGKTAGPLRIVVTVQPSSQDITQLGVDNAKREAVTAAVAAATSVGATAISPIADTEYVVMEVTQDQFDALITSNSFRSVSVDEILEANLASALPPIRAPEMNAKGANGAGRSVVVLDTGVQVNHPFLGGRVISEACFSSTTSEATSACPNNTPTQLGAGSAAPCANVQFCNHGTHVAGIIAGTRMGLTGVAPLANLVAIQVFSNWNDGGQPRSYTSDLLRALVYVRDVLRNQSQIAAINISIGAGIQGPCPNNLLAPTISQLRSLGVATVIAAGNEASNSGINAPGCVPQAITVGATNDDLSIAGFSNFADTIDVMGPGSNILSSGLNSGYVQMSGTSMATPVVAGAIAAFSSYYTTDVDRYESLLESTGTNVGRVGSAIQKPRINLLGALDALDASVPSDAMPIIKDAYADSGREPDPAVVGQAVSASPHIWIRSKINECGAFPRDHQNPEFGQPNYGCVQIDNVGKAGSQGTLELYFGGANLNNSASFQKIGSVFMTVPGRTSTIREIVWPTLPTPGHYCLLARFVPGDSTTPPPPLALPGGLDAAVRNFNKLAWRNINIVDLNKNNAGSAVQYVTESDGTVYMVVRISDLDPTDPNTLGYMGIATGGAIGNDPTQRYYQVDGGWARIPLKAGTYYIPIKYPGAEAATAFVYFEPMNKGGGSPAKDQMRVVITTKKDALSDKIQPTTEEPTVEYVLQR
ncbi:S8 family peptidase [Rhizobium leguminosarum]|uniref:S8 family peptidase n=1 Tax=Rhizobium leguminosarum TaxID=384 RepID=UPI001C955BB0|nr:S8 family serine peptidase [Rhizobium leguminosarum]MBY5714724.1 S8 family serine peptidase [Rhizobium leguminosarum]